MNNFLAMLQGMGGVNLRFRDILQLNTRQLAYRQNRQEQKQRHNRRY